MAAQESTGTALAAFESQLTAYLPDIAKLLPSGLSPERFAQVCMNAVMGNADLLAAVTKEPSARRTFFSEALKCATDGLLPDGREAAFTFYKTQNGVIVKYMPMVAGILKKVRNSGEIASITAEVVYENDEFDFVMGDDERIIHKRPKFGTPRGKPIGAYAIARTHKDGVYREVMDEAQLMAVRNVSRSKSGPWDGPFADEMRRKTVLRRIAKRLPSSSDIAGVVMRDDDLYDLEQSPSPELPAPPKVQASKTREAMGLSAPAAAKPKEDPPRPRARRQVPTPRRS